MATTRRKKWKAIDYIRKGWTQRAYARTKNGNGCSSDSALAVKWCASAAISQSYPSNWYKAYKKLQAVVGPNIIGWNDAPGRTKREVLVAFRKAGI